MAPEILNGHPYNYKADMYSFGVAMFEALMGVTPFFGSEKKDLSCSQTEKTKCLSSQASARQSARI